MIKTIYNLNYEKLTFNFCNLTVLPSGSLLLNIEFECLHATRSSLLGTWQILEG